MTQPLALLIDVTRCTGCQRCVAACKQENGLGPDRPWPQQERIDELSATRWTTVLARPGRRYVRQQCRHCVEPACVSACIVGAMRKTSLGAVVYDPDRCMGCRYCMLACPFGIPRYDWDRAIHSIRKCTLCYPRIARGQAPACVEACPENATSFGPRDQMLAEADRRIRSAPRRYLHRVYGRDEVGGTSVLYLSDIPLDFLGWKPDLADQPLPELTWAALRKVPAVVFGVGGLMAGLYWIIDRRMKLQGGASPSPPTDSAQER